MDDAQNRRLEFGALLESKQIDRAIRFLEENPIIYQITSPEPFLHYLSYGRHLEILQVVNLERINERHPFDGKTPLHYAVLGADNDSIPTIDFLIDHGADMTIRCKSDLTPLGLACQGFFDDRLIHHLYSRGAAVDLMSAFYLDNPDLIETAKQELAQYSDRGICGVYCVAKNDRSRKHAKSLMRFLEGELNRRNFDWGILTLEWHYRR